MSPDTSVAGVVVEVDGVELQNPVLSTLVGVEVESSLWLPDELRLQFEPNQTVKRSDVLTQAGLQISVPVVAKYMIDSSPYTVFTGEVTSVEAECTLESDSLLVRALDLSHRLMRGTKTMAYMNMAISDVVSEILSEAGVTAGNVDPTSEVYPVLTRCNVSDWVFIRQLAREIGYDAYTDSTGQFSFVKAVRASDGVEPATSPDAPLQPGQLTLGLNLRRLRAVVTGSDQVPAVQVRGWNPKSAQAVLGSAPATTTAAESADSGADPATIAGEVGAGTFTVTDRPYSGEDFANTRAQAVADLLGSAYAELEGEADPDPTLVAGSVVAVGLVGDPFDGKYVVSSARHSWAPGTRGYTTSFTLGGRQDRSLLALAGGGSPGLGSAQGLGSRSTIPGVAVGTVTDVTDPENQGRVKVMFPWLDDDYVSDWARVPQLWGGSGYGSVVLPEVNSEVLVGFDRGDPSVPYVLGNLYNGTALPSPPPNVDGGTVNERRFVSRQLHALLLLDSGQGLDDQTSNGIVLRSGDKSLAIRIDQDNQQISITSQQDIAITAQTGNITLQGQDVTVTAQGQLNMSGSTGVQVSSDADVQVSGSSGVTVSTPVDLSLSGDGSVSVSGAQISLGG